VRALRWRKHGQVYAAPPLHEKLLSHAANPLAVPLAGAVYRVYFSGRDAAQRSSVGYLDLNVESGVVEYVHDRPVFEHGPADSFYSHGVSIGNCYEQGGRRYILFMGWQCPPGEHWRGEVGRLVVAGEGVLQLDPAQPYMRLDSDDPVSLSYPWVMGDAATGYRMWYGSTRSWDTGHGEMLHVINGAVSRDGEQWHKSGLAVPFELGRAQAFSRPSVIGGPQSGYHMWFSYRGAPGVSYRIGYACSADGEHWQLALDKAGIEPSQSGWDAEMIEYPFVFQHRGKWLMLYNGNDYGRTGFGMAFGE
jgi:hypothetical protein